MEAADANGAGSQDEPVEWLDDHGQVIEVVPRSRLRAQNLLHHSVAIIVLSSDGRLLVHQRSATKDLRPSWWDVCAGGVVGAGEAVELAARRELAEELGIVGVELEWIATDRFDGAEWREICDLYRVVHDGPYSFADGEVARAMLVTAADFAVLATTEPFLESAEMILAHVRGFRMPSSQHRRYPRLHGADTLESVHRVEFTVEPFIEGHPGQHVIAPIDALRTMGIHVEVGPFGSSCLVPTKLSAEAVATIMREAFAHGATHVNVDVAAEDAA